MPWENYPQLICPASVLQATFSPFLSVNRTYSNPVRVATVMAITAGELEPVGCDCHAAISGIFSFRRETAEPATGRIIPLGSPVFPRPCTHAPKKSPSSCRERRRVAGHLLLVEEVIQQKGVAEDSGDADFLRVKGSADAALREVGEVLRVVDPPCSVVEPKVVIGVGGLPDREGGVSCRVGAHGCAWLRFSTGNQGNKKPPVHQDRRSVPWRVLVRRISPAAHRFAWANQPPWGFSFPGWQPSLSRRHS